MKNSEEADLTILLCMNIKRNGIHIIPIVCIIAKTWFSIHYNINTWKKKSYIFVIVHVSIYILNLFQS